MHEIIFSVDMKSAETYDATHSHERHETPVHHRADPDRTVLEPQTLTVPRSKAELGQCSLDMPLRMGESRAIRSALGRRPGEGRPGARFAPRSDSLCQPRAGRDRTAGACGAADRKRAADRGPAGRNGRAAGRGGDGFLERA